MSASALRAAAASSLRSIGTAPLKGSCRGRGGEGGERECEMRGKMLVSQSSSRATTVCRAPCTMLLELDPFKGFVLSATPPCGSWTQRWWRQAPGSQTQRPAPAACPACGEGMHGQWGQQDLQAHAPRPVDDGTHASNLHHLHLFIHTSAPPFPCAFGPPIVCLQPDYNQGSVHPHLGSRGSCAKWWPSGVSASVSTSGSSAPTCTRDHRGGEAGTGSRSAAMPPEAGT